MKKVILGICSAAIIALAVVNVNLALNSGSNANLTLASMFSLANGEEPGSVACRTLLVEHGFTNGFCPGLHSNTSQLVVLSAYNIYECDSRLLNYVPNATCQTGTETWIYKYNVVGIMCIRDYNETIYTPQKTISCPYKR